MLRFRLSLLLACTVGSALLWIGTASAQEGGRGGRGGGGGFGRMGGFNRTLDKPTLLGSDQVRKELKVNEEQGKKLEGILASHNEASREIFSSGFRAGGQSADERAKAREEMNKKTAELLKKTDGKLADVLDKAQSQRLDEIVLQQQGADALVSDNIVAALKLSKEQVDKIKAALAARDSELGKLGGVRGGGQKGGGGAGGAGAGGNLEETREKMAKLRKDAETTTLAFLSKEQGESLAKLKGAAFELDRQSLLRGGPGGAGGPGGPGGPGGRGGAGGPGSGGAGSKERKRPPEDDGK